MFDYSGKLYTFGCSMTKYFYPTWADILGDQFSKFENWGEPSAGNEFIFNAIIECLAKNKINKNDTFIIYWSNIHRSDYYQDGSWYHKVNQFSHNKDSAINCLVGNEITNYAMMYAIDQILSTKLENYYFITWDWIDNSTKPGQVYQSTLNKIKFWKPEPNNIPYTPPQVNYFYNLFKGTQWPSLQQIKENKLSSVSKEIQREIRDYINNLHEKYVDINKKIIDPHPTPEQHLAGLLELFPEVSIKQSTLDQIKDIQHKLVNGLWFEFDEHKPKEKL